MKIQELTARVIAEDARPSDEALDDLEIALGYHFPDDFRSFLKASSGGGTLRLSDLEYLEFKKANQTYYPAMFCRVSGNGYHSIRPLGLHLSEVGRKVDGVPNGIAVIAHDGSGNFLTIDLRSNSFGTVGLVDHETVGDSFEDDETYEIIAGSFTEFVEYCRIKRESNILTVGAGAPVEISHTSEIGSHLAKASRMGEMARIRDDTGAWMEFRPVRGGGSVFRTYYGSAATWQGHYHSPKSSRRSRSWLGMLFGSDVTIIDIEDVATLFEDFFGRRSSDLDIRWKKLA